MNAKETSIRPIFLDDKSNAYFHAQITLSGKARFGVGVSGIGNEASHATWSTFMSVSKLKEIHAMIGDVIKDHDNG